MEEHWIPVTERLPEIGVPVLVAGGAAMRREDHWVTLMDHGTEELERIRWPITHWMPLPKAHPDQMAASNEWAALQPF